MNIVCAPGLWLGGWSWTEVAIILRGAGHRVATPTLPGLDDPAESRAGIDERTHREVLGRIVQRMGSSVVVLGHGHASDLAHAVAAEHSALVDLLVLVDPASVTATDRRALLASPNGIEIPVPEWEQLAAARPAWTREIDAATWQGWASRAVPQPAGAVGSDGEAVRAFAGKTVVLDATGVGEHRSGATVTRVSGGHWPHLTRPADLAQALLATLPPST